MQSTYNFFLLEFDELDENDKLDKKSQKNLKDYLMKLLKNKNVCTKDKADKHTNLHFPLRLVCVNEESN